MPYGSTPTRDSVLLSILMGSIDRLTGDVEATSTVYEPKTYKVITQRTYALQCRPAQRMF